MGTRIEEEKLAYDYLRKIMNAYEELSEDTWLDLLKIFRFKRILKNDVITHLGEVPRSFYFVAKGLFRSYIITGVDKDKEVNKSFFEEGRFPASLVALLNQEKSEFCIQALEDSIVIEIDHEGYRRLLQKKKDLMLYHISYMEKHWVLEREPLEVSLLGDEGRERYLKFVKRYKHMIDRIPLYHIASRIGVTATQLSRIRKDLKK